MRKIVYTCVAGALLSLTAAPAFAHVTVQPNEAIAESFSKFTVRVPNETDDANTTKVEVQFPPMAFVSFQDVAGWERKVEQGKFDEPIEAFGSEITEGVVSVTWSGGEIAPGEFMEFPFSAAMPAGEVDLSFPSLQTYDNGDVVRWTGPEDADEPAPILSTVELGEIAEEGAGQLEVLHETVHELEELDGKVDELEVSTSSMDHEMPVEEEEDSDTLTLVLAAAGVVLGVIALIVALSKKKAA